MDDNALDSSFIEGLSGLERKWRSCLDRAKVAEHDVQQLKMTKESLNHRLNTATKEIAALHYSNEELQASKTTLNSDINELVKTTKDASELIGKGIERGKQLQARNNRLKEKIDSLLEIKQILAEERKRLIDEKGQITSERNGLLGKVETLEIYLEDSQKRENQLQSENDSLRSELERIKASMSTNSITKDQPVASTSSQAHISELEDSLARLRNNFKSLSSRKEAAEQKFYKAYVEWGDFKSWWEGFREFPGVASRIVAFNRLSKGGEIDVFKKGERRRLQKVGEKVEAEVDVSTKKALDILPKRIDGLTSQNSRVAVVPGIQVPNPGSVTRHNSNDTEMGEDQEEEVYGPEYETQCETQLEQINAVVERCEIDCKADIKDGDIRGGLDPSMGVFGSRPLLLSPRSPRPSNSPQENLPVTPRSRKAQAQVVSPLATNLIANTDPSSTTVPFKSRTDASPTRSLGHPIHPNDSGAEKSVSHPPSQNQESEKDPENPRTPSKTPSISQKDYPITQRDYSQTQQTTPGRSQLPDGGFVFDITALNLDFRPTLYSPPTIRHPTPPQEPLNSPPIIIKDESPDLRATLRAPTPPLTTSTHTTSSIRSSGHTGNPNIGNSREEENPFLVKQEPLDASFVRINPSTGARSIKNRKENRNVTLLMTTKNPNPSTAAITTEVVDAPFHSNIGGKRKAPLDELEEGNSSRTLTRRPDSAASTRRRDVSTTEQMEASLTTINRKVDKNTRKPEGFLFAGSKVPMRLQNVDGSDIRIPSPVTKRRKKADGEGLPVSSTGVKRKGVTTTVNAQYEVNPDLNNGLTYAYDEVVRKKDERRRMEAGVCDCCKDYYNSVKDLPPKLQAPLWRSPTAEEKAAQVRPCLHRLGQQPKPASTSRRDQEQPIDDEEDGQVRAHQQAISRHRHQWARAATPPAYWATGFPDTQEVADINARAEEMHEEKMRSVEKEAERGGKFRRR